jgi:hypothetical protein
LNALAIAILSAFIMAMHLLTSEVGAEENPETTVQAVGAPSTEDPEASQWHYGGFIDLGYALNFNFPANQLWRNRGTTSRVNELDLNMAGVSIVKDASTSSRWGMELLVHGGQDAKDFGFHANQPTVGSSNQLRHFGRANVSYLAPIGNARPANEN